MGPNLISSSSKTRVFVSGFGSLKKFKVWTKVHKPEIVIFSKEEMQFLKEFCFLKNYEKKLGKYFFFGFIWSSNAVKTAEKGVELEKTLKFGSVCFSSVRFEAWDQTLNSIEFGIWKLD